MRIPCWGKKHLFPCSVASNAWKTWSLSHQGNSNPFACWNMTFSLQEPILTEPLWQNMNCIAPHTHLGTLYMKHYNDNSIPWRQLCPNTSRQWGLPDGASFTNIGITSPVHLFSGENVILAQRAGVQRLPSSSNLPADVAIIRQLTKAVCKFLT